MDNRYLEKIAAMSLVGKSWVRSVVNSVQKSAPGAVSTANSKAKALGGNAFHKTLHSTDELGKFKDSKIMQSAMSKGLTSGEANRAVKLATGIAQRKLRQG